MRRADHFPLTQTTQTSNGGLLPSRDSFSGGPPAASHLQGFGVSTQLPAIPRIPGATPSTSITGRKRSYDEIGDNSVDNLALDWNSLLAELSLPLDFLQSESVDGDLQPWSGGDKFPAGFAAGGGWSLPADGNGTIHPMPLALTTSSSPLILSGVGSLTTDDPPDLYPTEPIRKTEDGLFTDAFKRYAVHCLLVCEEVGIPMKKYSAALKVNSTNASHWKKKFSESSINDLTVSDYENFIRKVKPDLSFEKVKELGASFELSKKKLQEKQDHEEFVALRDFAAEIGLDSIDVILIDRDILKKVTYVKEPQRMHWTGFTKEFKDYAIYFVQLGERYQLSSWDCAKALGVEYGILVYWTKTEERQLKEGRLNFENLAHVSKIHFRRLMISYLEGLLPDVERKSNSILERRQIAKLKEDNQADIETIRMVSSLSRA